MAPPLHTGHSKQTLLRAHKNSYFKASAVCRLLRETWPLSDAAAGACFGLVCPPPLVFKGAGCDTASARTTSPLSRRDVARIGHPPWRRGRPYNDTGESRVARIALDDEVGSVEVHVHRLARGRVDVRAPQGELLKGPSARGHVGAVVRVASQGQPHREEEVARADAALDAVRQLNALDLSAHGAQEAHAHTCRPGERLGDGRLELAPPPRRDADVEGHGAQDEPEEVERDVLAEH